MLNEVEKAHYFSFVQKAGANSCWLWTGSRQSHIGYGRFRPRPKAKPLYAHRLVYEMQNGSIPKGLHACHTCDNKLCVNPGHIFIGTTQDNTADMVRKGRNCWGEHHVSSKINNSIVANIRALFAAGIGRAELARRFLINESNVRGITKGRQWKQAPGITCTFPRERRFFVNYSFIDHAKRSAALQKAWRTRRAAQPLYV